MTWKTRAGYGAGDFGLNLFWQGAGLYLLFYYTDVVGLPAATAGLIFFMGSILGAVFDPVMGYIAQRSASNRGLYRPLILFGVIPLALGFFVMFSLPRSLSDGALTAAALISLIAFRLLYTWVAIPYAAMSARLTRDASERTALSGARMYFAFFGGITIVGAAYILQNSFEDRTAFTLMAGMAGIVGVLAVWLTYVTTPRLAADTENTQPHDIGNSLRRIFRNGPLWLLIGFSGLYAFGRAFVDRTVLYKFEYVFDDRGAGNIALLILTAMPLISIPIWSWIAMARGKKQTWLYASLMILAAVLTGYVLRGAGAGIAYMYLAVLAFSGGAFAVIKWSMLPDTIEYGEAKCGYRDEGLTIGIAAASQKAIGAVSALALGFSLEYVGYDAGKAQTPHTLDGLHTLSTLVPAAAFLIAACLALLYPLTEHRHGEIVAGLDAKGD